MRKSRKPIKILMASLLMLCLVSGLLPAQTMGQTEDGTMGVREEPVSELVSGFLTGLSGTNSALPTNGSGTSSALPANGSGANSDLPTNVSRPYSDLEEGRWKQMSDRTLDEYYWNNGYEETYAFLQGLSASERTDLLSRDTLFSAPVESIESEGEAKESTIYPFLDGLYRKSRVNAQAQAASFSTTSGWFYYRFKKEGAATSVTYKVSFTLGGSSINTAHTIKNLTIVRDGSISGNGAEGSAGENTKGAVKIAIRNENSNKTILDSSGSVYAWVPLTLTFTQPAYTWISASNPTVAKKSGSDANYMFGSPAGAASYTDSVNADTLRTAAINVNVLNAGISFSSYTGLHAVKQYEFKKINLTIDFQGNGSTGGTMAAQTLVYNAAAPLQANGFAKTGHHFVGWSALASADVLYANGQSVTPSALTPITTGNKKSAYSKTLYAKWEPNIYRISYDANGGTGQMEATQGSYGSSLFLSPNLFTRDQFVFAGWNTKQDGSGTSYEDMASVKNLTSETAVTLYAKWDPLITVQHLDESGARLAEDQVFAVKTGSTYQTKPRRISGYVLAAVSGAASGLAGDTPQTIRYQYRKGTTVRYRGSTVYDYRLEAEDALKKMAVTVLKTDMDGNPLQGAVFRLRALADIYGSDGTNQGKPVFRAGDVIATAKSDADGLADFGTLLPTCLFADQAQYLENGGNLYEITEISAPANCTISSDVIRLTGDPQKEGTETNGVTSLQLTMKNKVNNWISLEKAWLGNGTETVYVDVYQGESKVAADVELSAANGFRAELQDVPRTDAAGKTIAYRFVEKTTRGGTAESLPASYQAVEYDYDASAGLLHLINLGAETVSVQKLWDDADDADGIRPAEIKVDLIQVDVDDPDSWRYYEPKTKMRLTDQTESPGPYVDLSSTVSHADGSYDADVYQPFLLRQDGGGNTVWEDGAGNRITTVMGSWSLENRTLPSSRMDQEGNRIPVYYRYEERLEGVVNGDGQTGYAIDQPHTKDMADLDVYDASWRKQTIRNTHEANQDFTLEKRVEGNMASRDEAFSFSVTIRGLEPKASYTSYLTACENKQGEGAAWTTRETVSTTDANGVLRVKLSLSHLDRWRIADLPIGAECSVEEDLSGIAYRNRWQLSFRDGAGTDQTKDLTDPPSICLSKEVSDPVLVCINSRSGLIPTGLAEGKKAPVMACGALAAALAAILLSRKRKGMRPSS